MGIVIILTYTLFLAIPLFVLWRSIVSSEAVSFSTIKYRPANIIIDNNKDKDILVDIVDENEDDLFEDVE